MKKNLIAKPVLALSALVLAACGNGDIDVD